MRLSVIESSGDIKACQPQRVCFQRSVTVLVHLTFSWLGKSNLNSSQKSLSAHMVIELGRKNYDEAKKHLSSMKSLKYNPELEDEIEKVQEELKKSSTNTL
jgi:hypothetical protein